MTEIVFKLVFLNHPYLWTVFCSQIDTLKFFENSQVTRLLLDVPSKQ